jgi:hypothetical protein
MQNQANGDRKQSAGEVHPKNFILALPLALI